MASLPGEQAGPPTAPDQSRLAAALAQLGIAAAIETDGRMALLNVGGAPALPDAELRAAILQAGREAGYSSVAIELPEPTDAPR